MGGEKKKTMWSRLIKQERTQPVEETDAILSKIDQNVQDRIGRPRARSDHPGSQQAHPFSQSAPSSPYIGYPASAGSAQSSRSYANSNNTGVLYTGGVYYPSNHQPPVPVPPTQFQQQQTYQQQQAFQQQPMPLPPSHPHPDLSQKTRSSQPSSANGSSHKNDENLPPIPRNIAPPLTQSSQNTQSKQKKPSSTEKPAAIPPPPTKDIKSLSISGGSDFVYRPKEGPLEDSTEMLSHIVTQGLGEGLFSDLKLKVREKEYLLHRMILCRSPFFRKMFQENEVGSSVEIDFPDATEAAVDVYFAWLYGKPITVGEPVKDQTCISPSEVLEVVKVAHLFQAKELAEICMKFILFVDLAPHSHRSLGHQMFPQFTPVVPTPMETLKRYIDFVDNFDYGANITEPLEDALLNYLCLEGYSSLEDVFVHLPGAWLTRVLEADAFWCPNEFARYQFAKSVILQRRLNIMKTDQDSEQKLYEDIFRYGVIYAHMTFEQLQEVRFDGYVPEAILMKCLWQQTRFKSEIESSPESHVAFDETADPWAKRDPGSGTQSPQEMKKSSEVVYTSPVRVGVEFKDFHELAENERHYSGTFFYGGSWWSVFLQRFPAVDDDGKIKKQQKWGVFLRRAEGDEIQKLALSQTQPPAPSPKSEYNPEIVRDPLTGSEIERSISYYVDRRKKVRAVFKLFNPAVRSYEPVFISKSNDYAETQSWGYRSRDHVVTTGDMEAKSSVRLTLVMKYV